MSYIKELDTIIMVADEGLIMFIKDLDDDELIEYKNKLLKQYDYITRKGESKWSEDILKNIEAVDAFFQRRMLMTGKHEQGYTL